MSLFVTTNGVYKSVAHNAPGGASIFPGQAFFISNCTISGAVVVNLADGVTTETLTPAVGDNVYMLEVSSVASSAATVTAFKNWYLPPNGPQAGTPTAGN